MMDYPELIAEVTERSGDSAVAVRARMYLRLAEAEINKALRVAGNEESATITTDANGEARLPDDFSALRMIVMGNRELSAGSFQSLSTTVSSGYSVRGDTLITSWPDTDMTLHYYAKIPDLSLTGTNWLIETDPAIYIYAMLEQVFLAKLDAEKAAAAHSVFEGLIDQRRRDDYVSRFGNKPYMVTGTVV